METKINDVKEFAIGTKIEYMNKLYLVVAQTYCDNCSIANICSNNDVTKNDSYNLLTRDKRISIFGECSYIGRKDRKSVVFKEISTYDDDVYDVGVLYKNDKELLPIRINIPSGYTIDIENSDLANNIIKFKRKWLSLEQLYKLAKESNHVTHRDSIKYFSDSKLVALSNLMDIARYFNGDWKYSINCNEKGYSIGYDNSIKEPYYTVCTENPDTDMYFCNIVFKNKGTKKEANINFNKLIDDLFRASRISSETNL